MFRFTLATYMLLLSLTGPNLCCCTVTRFVEVAESLAKTRDDQGTGGRSCCQGRHEIAADQKRDDPKSIDRVSRQKTPPKHCKCLQRVCSAIPTSKNDFVLRFSRSDFDQFTFDLAAPFLFETGDIRPVSVGRHGRAPTTRSGREIHIDIHSWRC